MTARFRQWLEETHSDTFELVRHFLARFFDTEIGATNDDWRKVAIGILPGTNRPTGASAAVQGGPPHHHRACPTSGAR